jgi:hypothetical protein
MCGVGGGAWFFCGTKFCQPAEMAQSGESRKRWDGHLPVRWSGTESLRWKVDLPSMIADSEADTPRW